jgi:haloacetate dehalogenase
MTAFKHLTADGSPVDPDVSRRRVLLAGALAGLGAAIGDSVGEAAIAAEPTSDGTDYFPGFATDTVKTGGAATISGTTIHVLHKGSGPPLLLLHGYPETHLTWRKVAPLLAEQFAVVVPDLRGYGESGKPADGERHENYSFRAMAQDQVDVMRHFGHERFLVAAHDRGARATHRLLLDHPASVEKACLMDIAPTLTMYRGTNQAFATHYMWWFFLIQPEPLAEHMIGCNPGFYFSAVMRELDKTPGAISPAVMTDYLRAFSSPGVIHATCEDYRAAAGIGLEQDAADDASGKKIQCPLRVLWGGRGTLGTEWDVPATWQAKSASTVTGRPLDCGHFLQEEQPDAVLEELHTFFA